MNQTPGNRATARKGPRNIAPATNLIVDVKNYYDASTVTVAHISQCTNPMLNNTGKPRRQILLALVLPALFSGVITTGAEVNDTFKTKLVPAGSISRLELVALSQVPAWHGFRAVKISGKEFTAIAERKISGRQELNDYLALWYKVAVPFWQPTELELQRLDPTYQLRVLPEVGQSFDITVSWKQGIVVLSNEPGTWFRFDVRSTAATELKQATEKLLPHPAERERKVFWSDTGAIWRANLDGSKPEKVASNQNLSHFELAPCGQWLFISLSNDTDNASSILRLTRDGTEQAGLLNMAGRGGLRQVRGFASHASERRLYWTWSNGAPKATDEGRIASMNYDGSDERELPFTSIRRPADLAIDPRNQQVYWCDMRHERMDAAALEQGSVRTLYQPGKVPEIESHIIAPCPQSLALFPAAEKLYWKQQTGSRLIEADLNAKNPKIVLEHKSRIIGFAICPKLSRLYYMKFERQLYSRDLVTGNESLIWEANDPDRRPSTFCEIAVDTAWPQD